MCCSFSYYEGIFFMNNKGKHLTYEDRLIIEQFIKNEISFNTILSNLNVNKITLYREIKNRRSKLNNSSTICSKTNKFPFTCVNCKQKNYCKKAKYVYTAKNVQINYRSEERRVGK